MCTFENIHRKRHNTLYHLSSSIDNSFQHPKTNVSMMKLDALKSDLIRLSTNFHLILDVSNDPNDSGINPAQRSFPLLNIPNKQNFELS